MRIHTRIVIDIETGATLFDDAFDWNGPLALCDRSAQSNAKNAFNETQTAGGQYGNAAANISSTLVPTLNRELNAQQGLTPEQQNNLLVAGEQGAGGANAGITGQAGLQAMRTRNSGALSSVYDQAARRNAQTLSGNALGVANESTQLANKNKQAALQELGGLYGTNVSAQMKALGILPEDVNAEVNAGKSGWLQNLEGGLSAVSGMGRG